MFGKGVNLFALLIFTKSIFFADVCAVLVSAATKTSTGTFTVAAKNKVLPPLKSQQKQRNTTGSLVKKQRIEPEVADYHVDLLKNPRLVEDLLMQNRFYRTCQYRSDLSGFFGVMYVCVTRDGRQVAVKVPKQNPSLRESAQAKSVVQDQAFQVAHGFYESFLLYTEHIRNQVFWERAAHLKLEKQANDVIQKTEHFPLEILAFNPKDIQPLPVSVHCLESPYAGMDLFFCPDVHRFRWEFASRQKQHAHPHFTPNAHGR